MDQRQPWTKRIGILMTIILISVIVSACRKAPSPQTKQDVVSKDSKDETPSAEQPKAQTKPVSLPEMLTPEVIAAFRAGIMATDRYSDRIEMRRSLMYRLCQGKQIESALAEFQALLDDVEQREGRAMAMRVAISDAGQVQWKQDYAAAIGMYEVLLNRYDNSPFTAKALYQLGVCHFQMKDYVVAEQVWRRTIEEQDGSSQAPQAWQKLALAQMRQKNFDASLVTLDIMAAKYQGTPYEQHARLCRGDVLKEAGREAEARAIYTEFLEEHQDGSYRRLAEQRMSDLGKAVAGMR